MQKAFPGLPKNHCGPIPVAFLVSATEWAAQAISSTLEKVDECFESDFQAGYFLFQFLPILVRSWVRRRGWELEPGVSSHPDTGPTFVNIP